MSENCAFHKSPEKIVHGFGLEWIIINVNPVHGRDNGPKQASVSAWDAKYRLGRQRAFGRPLKFGRTAHRLQPRHTRFHGIGCT